MTAHAVDIASNPLPSSESEAHQQVRRLTESDILWKRWQQLNAHAHACGYNPPSGRNENLVTE